MNQLCKEDLVAKYTPAAYRPYLLWAGVIYGWAVSMFLVLPRWLADLDAREAAEAFGSASAVDPTNNSSSTSPEVSGNSGFIGTIQNFLETRFFIYALVAWWNFSFAMSAWSYYRAKFTDPGRPGSPAPFPSRASTHKDDDVDGTSRPGRVSAVRRATMHHVIPDKPIETKNDGESGRFCHVCNQSKPDRAHHCRNCGRCTYKMDHHCLWTNQCVGFYNYKFFLLALFWGGSGLAPAPIFEASMAWDLVNALTRTWADWLIILNMFVCGGMLMGIASLAFFHLRMVLANYTTLEFLEKQQPAEEGLRRDYLHMWDVGPRDNWVQVFGWNVLTWWFPVHPSDAHQDPAHFPLGEKARERLEV